jgi:hypothetical protein
MKILYLTTSDADYLQDGILYGLRTKFGADVIDFPKKQIMYQAKGNDDIYGRGFTLYGNLDDIKVDREGVWDNLNEGFDYIFVSSIYRQQLLFSHYRNYGMFKNIKTKWVFLDGEDDGFPCVVDATHFGTYFKRENPFNYEGVEGIGLSIPARKMLNEAPLKRKTFTTHVQSKEAYQIPDVAQNCTDKAPFATESEYYHDLSISKYGITMKKSGWDVPRHMENAGHYVVNCIQNRAWDGTTWADKPDVHPLGLKDMENCIIWDTPEELMQKIEIANKNYDQISEASRRWADTKTCEAMTDYVLSKI